MTSRLFFVMSHDPTRSPVQWNPQPKRPQDFSGKLEVGGILNFFQLIISFFRAIKTCSPNFFPASVPNVPRFWSRKNVRVFEIRNCRWSFKWCFLKKQGNKPGVILPLFRGFEVSLLPGCRCSRSTNGSTTPDQPCIGGGLGLWPTHGLISGEFGVISVRNFPRQFPPFPLGCLKTQKGHPSCVKVWRDGCSVFFFRAVNLPAAVVPKKGSSLKQQKPCH